MNQKKYSNNLKRKIVDRYLNGESITNLTREQWTGKKVNNHRRNIYLWIKKFGVSRSKTINRIKPKNKLYSMEFKYNIVRYLRGEKSMDIAKSL